MKLSMSLRSSCCVAQEVQHFTRARITQSVIEVTQYDGMMMLILHIKIVRVEVQGQISQGFDGILIPMHHSISTSRIRGEVGADDGDAGIMISERQADHPFVRGSIGTQSYSCIDSIDHTLVDFTHPLGDRRCPYTQSDGNRGSDDGRITDFGPVDGILTRST